MVIVGGFESLGQLMVKLKGGKAKRPKKKKLDDFHIGRLIERSHTPKKQSSQSMLSIIKSLTGVTRTITADVNPDLDWYGGPAIKPHDPNYKG